ncbi:MAG: DUF2911 domain-containing protein [Salinibacter sp.]
MTLRQTLPVVLSFFALLFGSVPSATAQERGNKKPRVSPNAAVSQTIGTTEVRITYGRPHVKGRTIFGGLVPYGEVWRTGANEATTFSVSSDVMIEGQPLSKGTYSLYTIPGKKQWTIIFNKVANQWGTEYDSSKDALRVKVTPRSAQHREMMMFFFENVTAKKGTCVLHWAEVQVPFEIRIAEN